MPTGGWSGLWNHVEKKQHSLLGARGQAPSRRIGKIAHTIGGVIASERVFTDLNENIKRSQYTSQPGNPIVNGGKIPIATENLNPIPAAQFIDMVEKSNAPTTYPPDKSGNGGGGKLGFKL